MNESLKHQHQRPEGALIERVLKGPPKKSVRQFAIEVGLSEARIRQIINGYRSESGQVLKIVGRPETVARLAHALDITPEQLVSADRPDAAETLVELIAQSARVGARPAEVALDIRALKAELREWIDESAGISLYERPPPPDALYLWSQEVSADVLADRVHAMKERNAELLGQLHERDKAIYEFHQILKGGDGNADSTEPGGSAPTRADHDLAAHDDPDNPPGAPEE